MKKITTALLVLGSLSTFAGTEIVCKSPNYLVSVIANSSKKLISANYGINRNVNEAADVEIERSYLSDRVLAAQLKVDGVSNKFEISMTKNAQGVFEGKIFTGKTTQNAKCSASYFVTAEDRDDDGDSNL